MALVVVWWALVVAVLLSTVPAPQAVGKSVPYQDIFQQIAGTRWVDRAAQAQAESGFNPKAQSSAGAKGLMQAMDQTWLWYQKIGWLPKAASPFDPQSAIQGGCHHMLWLEARYSGNWHKSLGGYNAGQGTIDRASMIASTMGVPGVDAWLTVLPKVSGQANAKQTAEYIIHNDANRAAINRREQ